MAGAEKVIAECEAGAPLYFEYHARLTKAWIGLAREASDELVLEELRRAVEVGRAVKDLQVLVPTLGLSSLASVELGRLDEARAAAEEVVGLITDASSVNLHRALDISWVAETLGCADAFRSLLAGANPENLWVKAFTAVLDRDFGLAADLFAEMGNATDGAYAHLKAADELVTEGHHAEADTHLQKALAFYRSVAATRYVRQAEALLAAAS